MRRLTALACIAFLVGCGSPSTPQPSGGKGSAATDVGINAAGDAGGTYPVAIEATKEMAEAAELESKNSAAMDAACAEKTDISSELDAERPDLGKGKRGCPRPQGDNPSTWSAQ